MQREKAQLEDQRPGTSSPKSTNEVFMKNEIRCPVCRLNFDARTPYMHIQQHHKDAKDSELTKIRNARRKCFKEPVAKKSGGKACLSQVAIYNAGHRTVRKDVYHVVKG